MLKIILAFLLMVSPVYAGSISVTVAQNGFVNTTKSYAIPDADIDRIVAAYQIAANADLNATATRAQVLLYLTKRWMAEIANDVKSAERQKAQDAIVAPVPVNPQ